MDKKVINNIVIEGAQIIFKNFQGAEKQFNTKGNRNFGVIIPEYMNIEALVADGWNLKTLVNKDDPNEPPTYWLPVKIKYGNIPPVAYIIHSAGKGKTKLTEETIGQLDWAYFTNVDVVIRPYNYPGINGGKPGVAAYMKAIYVTIAEDDLSLKYGEIPEMI